MNLKISIIVDNENSWMNPYAKEFTKSLQEKGHKVIFHNTHDGFENGDIAVFLSCEKIISKETMKLNKHNLVVHESDLPQGKGWSPVTWQVIEGKDRIPITLFEAVEKVDAGSVYSKDFISLEGHELIDEIRKKQAEKTFELVSKFIEVYPNIEGKPQQGEESFYKKRTPKDSELDINKSIKEQFNLLRVVDNKRYPAFFYHKGHKYVLTIKEDESK